MTPRRREGEMSDAEQGATPLPPRVVGSSSSSSSRTSELVEELAIVVGLIVVQIIYAVYAVVVSHLLSLGLTTLFLVIYGTLATSVFLFPFAVCLERTKWPTEFKPKLWIQLVLIAFGGITAFQVLMLLGIENTSPSVASAMPNLAPGLIFVIAWCFRLEKVDLKCKYSKAKIFGTLVCLAGALSMGFFKGQPISPDLSPHHSYSNYLKAISNDAHQRDWIMGTLCLIAAVLTLSCTMVLQATTLSEFPAPMTLCSVTSFIGVILAAILQYIQEGRIEIGTPLLSVGALVGFVLVGGGSNGLCIAFQAWSMRKRGPVLVSMFGPVATVCTAILSAITLGEAITLGSIGGMGLMFGGLYCVLWAKKKEGFGILEEDKETLQIHDDEKKPLLS